MKNILENPTTIYAEAYSKLKTSIKYSSADKNNKVFLITSSEKGEGKSTTATNLAISLSFDKKKVLLVDCDLRRSSLHKYLRISGECGLTEVITGETNVEKAIVNIKDNLFFLPSGNRPPNPAELLGSENFELMLKELKDIFDYIIIDSPPLRVVADAQILSSKVDGVILVVKYGFTKKDELLVCRETLELVGGKLIGTVINGDKKENDYKYYYY